MKQAMVLVKDIKENIVVIKKTESTCLKQDRTKYINRCLKELKDYCKFKNLNYKKLIQEELKEWQK